MRLRAGRAILAATRRARLHADVDDPSRDRCVSCSRRGAGLRRDARARRSQEGGGRSGRPDRGALVVAAAKAGLHKRRARAHAVRGCTRSRSPRRRKRMTTLHATHRGALDRLRQGCAGGHPRRAASRSGCRPESVPLDATARSDVLGAAQRHGCAARCGCWRLRAKRRRPLPRTPSTGMTFLGLVGMIDPPRPEARAAIAHVRGSRHPPGDDHRRPPAHRAGGRPRARAAATTGRVVTGAELEAMSDGELEREVDRHRRLRAGLPGAQAAGRDAPAGSAGTSSR